MKLPRKARCLYEDDAVQTWLADADGSPVTLRGLRPPPDALQETLNALEEAQRAQSDEPQGLLGFGEQDGWVWFWRSFVDGVDLFELAARSEDARLAPMLLDILAALAPRHSRGRMHGRVKPTNFIVDTEGRVHAVDFGIDDVVETSGVLASTSVRMLGLTAPELLESFDPPTGAADIYGAAATVLSLFAGEIPSREGLFRVLDALDLKPRLAALLRTMLEPHPRRRPGIPAALAELRSIAGTTLSPAGTLALPTGVLDLATRAFRRPEDVVRLTTQEAALIQYLASKEGRAVSREELLSEVWQYASSSRSRAVDACVSRLRKKIERDPGQPEVLVLVQGVGYRLHGSRTPQPSMPARKTSAPALPGRGPLVQRVVRALTRTEGVVWLQGAIGVGKTAIAQAVEPRLTVPVTWWTPGYSGETSTDSVLFVDGHDRCPEVSNEAIRSFLDAGGRRVLVTSTQAPTVDVVRALQVPELAATREELRALWDTRLDVQTREATSGNPVAIELSARATALGIDAPTALRRSPWGDRVRSVLTGAEDRTAFARLATVPPVALTADIVAALTTTEERARLRSNSLLAGPVEAPRVCILSAWAVEERQPSMVLDAFAKHPPESSAVLEALAREAPEHPTCRTILDDVFHERGQVASLSRYPGASPMLRWWDKGPNGAHASWNMLAQARSGKPIEPVGPEWLQSWCQAEHARWSADFGAMGAHGQRLMRLGRRAGRRDLVVRGHLLQMEAVEGREVWAHLERAVATASGHAGWASECAAWAAHHRGERPVGHGAQTRHLQCLHDVRQSASIEAFGACWSEVTSTGDAVHRLEIVVQEGLFVDRSAAIEELLSWDVPLATHWAERLTDSRL